MLIKQFPYKNDKGMWEIQQKELSILEQDAQVFLLLCDIANALNTLVSLQLVESAGKEKRKYVGKNRDS